MTTSKEKIMERAIEFLMECGTDIAIQSEGKSVLLLALESADPVTTTKVLLRAALWKDINKPFNQYSDGKYTFSPTTYVQRLLPDSDHKMELLRLLRSNRCTDIYYANSGPQVSPEPVIHKLSSLFVTAIGKIGLPRHIHSYFYYTFQFY